MKMPTNRLKKTFQAPSFQHHSITTLTIHYVQHFVMGTLVELTMTTKEAPTEVLLQCDGVKTEGFGRDT